MTTMRRPMVDRRNPERGRLGGLRVTPSYLSGSVANSQGSVASCPTTRATTPHQSRGRTTLAFDLLSAAHEHEHNHAAMIHGRAPHQDFDEEHAGEAHVHDHEHPAD
jgi:hypothetical protein